MADLVQKVIFHYKQIFKYFTNYTIDYTVAPSFHETKPFIRISAASTIHPLAETDTLSELLHKISNFI